MNHNETDELYQLKREMDYYKLDNLQNDIVTKYINENNLLEARRIFNRFKDENQCKLDKKVHLWIGIFIGVVVVPVLWDMLVELFIEIAK